MAWIQSGSCPKCGAPIYTESPWWGVTPAPTRYSCMCHRETMQYEIVTTTDTK